MAERGDDYGDRTKPEPFSEATGQVEAATRDLSEVGKAKSRQVDLAEEAEDGPDAEGEPLPPRKPQETPPPESNPDAGS